MHAEVAISETMPMERLEAEITELAGHLAAAECRWLLLVGEFDRRRGYEGWGCRTCSHWLSWHCGLNLRAARRASSRRPGTRVASAYRRRVLGRQAELLEGPRADTRVATRENERDLATLAEHATAVQVERVVRTYRGVLTQDEELDATNARHAARYLRCD